MLWCCIAPLYAFMFVRFVLCCNFCQKAGFAHFECVQTRVYKCVFRGESQVVTDYAIFERGHISQGVLSVICHECYKFITLLITIFLLQHHFPRAAIQHKLKGFRSKLKEDVEVTSVEYKHTHWLWTLCRLFCVRSGVRFQWTVRTWFVKSSVIFSQYLWCLVVSWFPEFDMHCSFPSKNLGFIHTKQKRTWKRSSHKAYIISTFTFTGPSVWMNSQLIVWWKCIPKNAMVLFICVYVTINNVWLSQWYISNDVFPFFLPPPSPCYHFVGQRRQGQI